MTVRTGSALAAGLLMLAPSAFAQQTAQLEEIVVTARKVSENIMNVPLAITALTANDIQSANIIDTKSVGQFSPGLYFKGQGGIGGGGQDRTFNGLIFRGLSVANNFGITAGGLVFLDGAPITSGVVGDLVSIDHVEVLKGPQSAYFGRSTFAGAVNYITKDPADQFSGRLTAQYSSYGSTDDSLMLEGPLVPGKLDMRVTGRYYVQGGQYVNYANPSESLGRRNTDSIATTIVAKPNDALKIKLYATYFEYHDGQSATAQLQPSEAPDNLGLGLPGQGVPSNLFPLVPSKGDKYWAGIVPWIGRQNIGVDDILTPSIFDTLINNSHHQTVDFDPHFNPKIGLRSQNLEADLTVSWEGSSGYTVTSTSAYHKNKYQNVNDLDYRDVTPYLGSCFAGAGIGPNGCLIPFTSPWIFVVQGISHDESEELRVSSPQQARFRWMAGGDYVGNSQGASDIFGVSPIGVINSNNPQPQIHTPSVFGGVYYDITQALTISGEARYQWDQVHEYPVGGAPLYGDFKSFSPRVTLDYKFAENSMVYALYSRGYRPGGFNGALEGASASDLAQIATLAAGVGLSFKQEEIQNWEVGLKSRFLDNRADVKIAAYVGKLQNQQVAQSIFTNEGGGAQHDYGITSNIGLTDLRGIEFEGNLQATDHLKFTLSLAENITDIRQYFCSFCQNYVNGNSNPVGNRLPYAPAFTGFITAQYTNHLAGDYDWFARIDYIVTGNEYADETNTARTGTRQDLRLRVGVQNQTFSIETFVTNATQDKHYAGIVPDLSTLQGLSYNAMNLALPDKREFGVRASYNF